MKDSSFTFHQKRRGLSAARRNKLLDTFDRSGLSAAAFARQHDINYTTFCGWRQRREKVRSVPAFVEVEMPAATAPVELVLELGSMFGAGKACPTLGTVRRWRVGWECWRSLFRFRDISGLSWN